MKDCIPSILYMANENFLISLFNRNEFFAISKFPLSQTKIQYLLSAIDRTPVCYVAHFSFRLRLYSLDARGLLARQWRGTSERVVGASFFSPLRDLPSWLRRSIRSLPTRKKPSGTQGRGYSTCTLTRGLSY